MHPHPPSRARAMLVVLAVFALALTASVDASSYDKRAMRETEHKDSPTTVARARFLAYTWGIGGDRVGRPSNDAPTPPGAVELDSSAGDVLAIAASGHTAVATSSGRLYTAGRNDSSGGGGHGSAAIDDSGQLGRQGALGALGRVEGALEKESVMSVACGRYHTTCATASGRVYSFGLNDVGQLGTSGVMGKAPDAKKRCDSGGNCDSLERDAKALAGEGESCFGGAACRSGTPSLVKFPEGTGRIKSVAAGRYTSAAVTTDGRVFVWGLNACGGAKGGRQSLLDDARAASTPRPIDGVREVEFLDIGYTSMIFLTKTGEVFTCDTGFDGYARVAEKSDESITRHPTFANDHAIDVAAGRCHFAVATKSGALYTWGCKALGREGSTEKPARVVGDLSSRRVVSVAAGEYFTLVTTMDGEIYGTGSNGNGQLGTAPESTTEYATFERVSLGTQAGDALAVAAGYQHSIAIVAAST